MSCPDDSHLPHTSAECPECLEQDLLLRKAELLFHDFLDATTQTSGHASAIAHLKSDYWRGYASALERALHHLGYQPAWNEGNPKASPTGRGWKLKETR